MFTTRFFVLSLGIPALLLLAEAVPALLPIAPLYAVVVFIAGLVDRQTAGTPQQFKVKREFETKLSLAAQNPITIHLTSYAKRPLAVTLRDEPPYQFTGALPDQVTTTLSTVPHIPQTFTYAVRPLQRGDYQFGNINLRWLGPLGLFRRQAVVPLRQPIKVYPNLIDIHKFDLLSRRNQLVEMGFHLIRQRGEGTMFESLREYTPDDPYRSINWKATARRGKPISTEYEPERSQRVVAAIDVGRMMRSPIRVDEPDGLSYNMAKTDFVINSVLMFSYVATLKGDHVGLLVFSDHVHKWIPPSHGRAHFQKLLDAMYALQSQPYESDYAAAIHYLRVQNKKRSLITMFTDLSGLRAAETLTMFMPRLAPHHVPLLVTIRDPALSYETQQPIHTSEAMYRTLVAEEIIEERRVLLESLSRHGVFTLDVDARHLTMEVINRYLQLKSRLFA